VKTNIKNRTKYTNQQAKTKSVKYEESEWPNRKD